MKLLEVVKQLAKKSAHRHISRSSTKRARPHLEALETRMALSGSTGGDPILVPPPPPTSA
jgi:hypothetical protein